LYNIINDVRVETWNELLDELYANSWQDDIQRYRSDYVFRGLSNLKYKLETTLIRLGESNYKLERHIIRNFIKYARVENSQNYNTWNWLALAQHHGLPTRLLDWTYSPFVAMHFATSEISSQQWDGLIWCVNYKEFNNLLRKKFEPIFAENEGLEEIVKAGGANAFTVRTLLEIAPEPLSSDAFFKIKKEKLSLDEEFILFFEPPSMDERIVNQFALHSIASHPQIAADEIIIKHPSLYKRIIIPSELKWEIRDKLDQANINERVLFPSLDGLAKWLTRYYSPHN